MYAAIRSNDIRTLSTTADRLGVTLPGNVPAMVDHLDAIQADHRQDARSDLNAVAAELTTHLGNPTAMTKARKAAAADLAAAEAHQRISAPLIDRCVAVAHQQIRAAREEISALFADALAPQIAHLNADADRLPEGFKPEHGADLDPGRFEAWTRARDAHAALTSTRQALAMLYGRLTPDNLLTIDALTALTYTALPDRFSDYTHAHRFARALAGVRHGGSSVGVVNIDGVFAPTALAHLGATFKWAGPGQVARRVEAITAAAVQPRTERVPA